MKLGRVEAVRVGYGGYSVWRVMSHSVFGSGWPSCSARLLQGADEKVDSRLTKRVEHGAHGDRMGLLPREGKTCLEVAEKGEYVCLRFITALHPCVQLVSPLFLLMDVFPGLWIHTNTHRGFTALGPWMAPGPGEHLCCLFSPPPTPSLSSNHYPYWPPWTHYPYSCLGHITHTPALAL